MSVDVTVIILTFNEEKNIEYAIKSALGWARDIFILDSYSSDNTVKIAENLGAKVFYREFDNYSLQRNYAIKELPVKTEWIFFLDADEVLPEDLKKEITAELAKPDLSVDGYYVRYKLIWFDAWIKHGYYNVWLMRLFKRAKASYNLRKVNEHINIKGNVGYLKSPFLHVDRKGIKHWLLKHIKYAEMEAELFFEEKNKLDKPKLFRSQAETKRWMKINIWNRLPLFVRPFIYFFYRYIIKLGFLDGWQGLTYHFLQGFWFYFLIDIMIKKKLKENK